MSMFDDMLAVEQARVGSIPTPPPPEPTTYDNKAASLDEKYEKKKQQIEPATIAWQEDADSVRYADEAKDMRFKGFDSYEVPHYLDPNKEGYESSLRSQDSRMDRQRERYAKQFNRESSDVTDQDIHREGMKENLQSLYNKTKSPNDIDRNGIRRGDEGFQDWTPGPIADAWIPEATAQNPNPSQLGSRETPLDIAVGRRYQRNEDGSAVTGKYGRKIGEEFNIADPEAITNVNESMTGSHNAQVYTDGSFDKAATEDKRASLGGWKGTPPSKIETFEEQAAYEEWSGDSENMFSEAIDRGQASLANYAGKHITGQAAAIGEIINRMYGGEDGKITEEEFKETTLGKVISKIDEYLPDSMKEDYKKKFKEQAENPDFLGTGLSIEEVAANEGNILDQKYGVSKEHRDLATHLQKSGAEDFKNHEYGAWLKKRVNDLPGLTTDSLGAMALLLAPGGSAAFTMTEMEAQTKEFEKKNDRPMTNSEYLQTLGVTYGTTVLEKVLAKFGLEKLTDVLKSTKGKGIVKKVLTGGAGLVVASGGEVIQEASEAIRQDMTGRKLEEGENLFIGDKAMADLKKSATSAETWEQGLTAGLSAGGMAATGGVAAKGLSAVPGAPGKVLDGAKWLGDKRKQSQFKDAVSNLSDAEYDVMVMDENKIIEETEADGKSIEDTLKIVTEAKSVQEMVDSGNVDIANEIERIKKTEELDLGGSETFKTVKEALKTHFETASDADVNKRAERAKIDADLSKEEKIEALLEDDVVAMQAKKDDKKAIESEVIEGQLDNIRDRFSSSLEKALEHNDNLLDMSDKKLEQAAKAREKGSTKLSGKRSDKDVNLKDVAKLSETPGNIMEAIHAVTANMFHSEARQVRAATEKKLSEYSNESLNDFVDNSKTNGKEQKLARKIVKQRERAAESLGATVNYSENENLSKKKDSKFSSAPSKKSANYAKIRRLVSQVDIDSKTEKNRLLEAIEALRDKGDINDKQAEILTKRLGESAAYARKKNKSKDRGAIFETRAEIRADLIAASEKLDKAQKKLEKEEKNKDSFEDINELKADIKEKRRYIVERQKELKEVTAQENEANENKKSDDDEGGSNEDSGPKPEPEPEPTSGNDSGGSKKKEPKKKPKKQPKKTGKKTDKKKDRQTEDAEYIAENGSSTNPIFDTKEGKLSGNYTKEDIVLNDSKLPEGQELSEEIYDASELLNLC